MPYITKAAFFNDYVDLCGYTLKGMAIPANSRIITSDDVFDFMLNLRMLNEGIDSGRENFLRNTGKSSPPITANSACTALTILKN